MRRVKSVITKKSIKRVLISGLFVFALAISWQFVLDRQALAAACATPATDNGTDTMTLNVPGAATYTLWVRMMVPDTTNNAINAQIDTSTCFNVGGSAGISPNTWTWVNYQNGVTGTPNSIALTSGSHTVKLVGTSPGVSVDRVILTSDTTCTPTGTGDNCATGDSTPPTVSLTAPANNATVSGNVTLSATASDASGISSVKFLVDGNAVNTDTSSPYSFSWNSSSVANGSHTITAQATDTANNTANSTSVSVTVSNSTSCTANPSVPTGLAVTGTSPNSVSLSWNASTPGANCTMQGYKVFRGGTLVTTVTSGTAFTDSGLNPSTSYSYTVAAIDTSNHTSAQTSAVNGTTVADTSAPSAPTNLHTSLITNNSIALAWTDSTDNVGVTGYRVFRNGTQVGTSANATYTDTGLTANTQYTYTVKAYDSSNNVSNASNSLSATTLQGSGGVNGDVNSDGHVNITDLSILLSHYGMTNATGSNGDCNGDGTVNITDLSILLTNYGT
ncbi:MAG TPA: Ig-like domain-containing protein [Candidatus Saccharimonadales bacterium]|nr:Ig-like domain-containing protein [Candidatus Saccharimonadales bacterium]